MRIFLLAALIATSGCADAFLDREERRALGSQKAEFQPTILDSNIHRGGNTSLGQAAKIANRFSEAYFQAARKSSRAQDVASGVVIVSAASVVLGAVGSASDTALANRAVLGVGAERIANRGVPKTSIASMLKGAKTMNCISTVATIYSASDSSVGTSPLAQELTFAAIREVRIAVRNDLARDVADFSALVTAFKDAIPAGGGDANVQALTRTEQGGATKAELEAYLARLSGCLKKPEIAENNATPVEVTVKMQ